uniref:Phospholipase A1 n=1 Tax=Rhizophora mucronata TaxID=61149 RepID=A0A2P2PIA2_RHIMU
MPFSLKRHLFELVHMESTAESDPQEPTWPQLLGSNDWHNLLDPLDLNLRRLILRCGDFCQATYDSFNNDQGSKYCGTSRYGKASFFHKVMLEDAENYQVASFLYGAARVSVPEAFLLHSQSRELWDRESNWIGYIAVTSDEYSKTLGRREIYIAFRGTTRNYEWIDIMGAKLQSATALLRPKSYKIEGNNNSGSSDSDDDDDEKVTKVMLGWLTIYISDDPRSPFTKLSARDQILTKINELRKRYQGENLSIIFTGHSLGASLSILAAFDLVENGVTDIPVAAFVFGSPQVGNKAFNERFKSYPNLKVLHIKNKIDVIPHYPGKLLGYVHTGTKLVIDTRKSPSLKDSKYPSDWHNLQAMLHIVAGWNGKEREFELKVKRSFALVNKSCSFLKDECLVPGSWWVEKNKGMARDENGDWVLDSPDEEDLPVPEY